MLLAGSAGARSSPRLATGSGTSALSETLRRRRPPAAPPTDLRRWSGWSCDAAAGGGGAVGAPDAGRRRRRRRGLAAPRACCQYRDLTKCRHHRPDDGGDTSGIDEPGGDRRRTCKGRWNRRLGPALWITRACGLVHARADALNPAMPVSGGRRSGGGIVSPARGDDCGRRRLSPHWQSCSGPCSRERRWPPCRRALGWMRVSSSHRWSTPVW